MTKPVVTATTLVTEDGVPIDAIHLPGTGDLAIVAVKSYSLPEIFPAVRSLAAGGATILRICRRRTPRPPWAMPGSYSKGCLSIIVPGGGQSFSKFSIRCGQAAIFGQSVCAANLQCMIPEVYHQ